MCLNHPCIPAYISHLATLTSTARWSLSLLEVLASISIWLLLIYTAGHFPCYLSILSHFLGETFQLRGSHPPGSKTPSHPWSSLHGLGSGSEYMGVYSLTEQCGPQPALVCLSCHAPSIHSLKEVHRAHKKPLRTTSDLWL